MSYLGGISLSLDMQQKQDIRRLNDEFRNNFSHFTPKGWSIERIGLPRIVANALDAVAHLMRQPQVAYKLDEQQTRELEKNLASIRIALQP
ncbi:MAG: hypothetical protein MUO41_07610 [Methyloceanibacter sp.]|nr:hypothetical protein [Methyloceanibacter sp.]